MPAPLQQQRSTPRMPAPMPARSAKSIDDLNPPMWICCPISSSQRLPSGPLYTAVTSFSPTLSMDFMRSLLQTAIPTEWSEGST